MSRRGGEQLTGQPERESGAQRLLAPPPLARLAQTLVERPGAIADVGPDVRRAAVALVVRVGLSDRLELLFIERAVYPGDPWSGQVAFPGGRREPTDESLRDTAMRETREELGFDIGAEGLVLGSLDELPPVTPALPPIVVRPYVAVVAPDVPMTLSEEVARAFWAPLDELCAPNASVDAAIQVRGESRVVPCVSYAGYTIWGMTERIFRDFQRRLGPDFSSPGS